MAALIDARPCTCTQEERGNEAISEPRRGPAELFNARGLGFGDDHGGRLLEEFRLQVDLMMGWLTQVKTIGLVTRMIRDIVVRGPQGETLDRRRTSSYWSDPSQTIEPSVPASIASH